MSEEFEHAYEEVKKLVHNFDKHKSHYMDPSYQEAETRQDFIDKFFEALGWDVSHKHQTNPYKQEVKVEKNIRTTGSQRRADYAFSVAPNYRDVKFYVEAKKPSVEIGSKDTYFQIIRYGWNSKTPIGVLTDFEQFHVVDCRYIPNIETALDQGIKGLQFYYNEYLDKDKFSKIYWLFSREAVVDNSIDDFAAALPKRRGKVVQKGLFRTGIQDIDDAFLDDLDTFRDALAHMFKKADNSLDGLALTEMVQRTIDRLVFLRFLEDKWIEINYRISDFGNSGSCWRDFIAASRKLDAIYNGVVFKKHELLDAASFKVDDTAFDHICEKLSHDHTPYDFNIVPIHILGSIYERFLGKVIVSTEKRAHVEAKPEVRKAGGVFYTPEYIVRYIVENTIGKLIEGKHPNEVAKMHFADISCGSGSFLLGAYDYLLEYHRHWYNDNLVQPRKSDCYKHEDGTLHLTLEKKREILLNNIYGVDIDHQAVEVAQLSLYLKLLEDETTSSASQFLLGFEQEKQRKQLLPSLNSNIKCGNSLIGPDFYDQQELELSETEFRRVNAFDWQSAFPKVFSNQKGFDAVIGNPPYVVVTSELLLNSEIEYLHQYQVAQYKTDLYHLFIEKGVSIVSNGGLLGYIVPNPWLTMQYTSRLREYVLQNTINELVIFNHRVFNDADVYTLILLLEHRTPDSNHNASVVVPNSPEEFQYLSKIKPICVSQGSWASSEGACIETRLIGAEGEVVKRLVSSHPTLGAIARVSLGCQAYNRSKHSVQEIEDRVFHSETKLSNEYLPELAGSDVGRYEVDRIKGQWIKYGPWLHDYRTMDWLTGPRILIREITGRFPYRIQACFVEETFCNYKTILNVNPMPTSKLSMKYLTGLLNSTLLSFLYPFMSNKMVTMSFPRLSVKDLRKLPIKDLDLSVLDQKELHDQMVKLVDRRMFLTQQMKNEKTDANKNMYQSQIISTDRQIDKLVYDLYGLTEEEIAIVEKSAKAEDIN